jgi:hypothetical protein
MAAVVFLLNGLSIPPPISPTAWNRQVSRLDAVPIPPLAYDVVEVDGRGDGVVDLRVMVVRHPRASGMLGAATAHVSKAPLILISLI